jgi:hypothetical protein
MELRKHPRLIWRGRRNWPPNWSGPHGPHHPLPKGEVGILVEVKNGAVSPIPHCLLIMRYNEQNYYGSLFFDDWGMLNKFSETLRRHIGLPISEIGSLDFL